jgi:hypothetical protein
LSRKTITVRAILPISSCASVAGMATAAPDQPAEQQAKSHRAHPHRQDHGAGAALRSRQRRGRRRFLAAGEGRYAIGCRKHLTGPDIDDREQRPGLVGAGYPVGKRLGVAFHCLAEFLLHDRGGDDAVERLGERSVLVLEHLLHVGHAAQAILDLVSSHHEQREEQLLPGPLGHPRQVVVEHALDRGAGLLHAAVDALVGRIAECFLALIEQREGVLQKRELALEDRKVLGLGRVEQLFQLRQVLGGLLIGGAEITDQRLAGPGGEFRGRGPHRGQRPFELAAGLGECPRPLDAVEGGRDLALARHVRQAVGDERDHRDQRQDGDTGADRDDRKEAGGRHLRNDLLGAVRSRQEARPGSATVRSGKPELVNKTSKNMSFSPPRRTLPGVPQPKASSCP